MRINTLPAKLRNFYSDLQVTASFLFSFLAACIHFGETIAKAISVDIL